MCRGLLFSCLVGLLMFACFLFTVRLKSNAAKLQAVAYEFFSVCFRCLSSGYELNFPHCPSRSFNSIQRRILNMTQTAGARLDQQCRPAKHLPAERQSPERIHPSACRNTLFVRRPASVTQRGSVFIATLKRRILPASIIFPKRPAAWSSFKVRNAMAVAKAQCCMKSCPVEFAQNGCSSTVSK